MSESPADTLDTARRLLSSGRQISLATQGVRIWSELLPFRFEGEQILCELREDSQSLANIRKNPRVSFSLGGSRLRRRLSGSGIARVSPGAQGAVAVSPYRFRLEEAETCTVSAVEKRRLEWRSVDAAPISATGPAGLAQSVRFWLRAARAVSFPLSILPVLLGTALALIAGAFDPAAFLLALIGGVAAHAGINLISDYNDFRKGVDTTDALSSHPGALVDEVVTPESILAGSLLLFLLACQAGAFLLVRAGPIILVFEAVGLLGGVFYTGGGVGYKYRGAGELFVGLLMGPLMVLGAYVVQAHRIDALPVLLSLTLGCLVASVTLANNLRDVNDDTIAGISTLPMRLGVRPSKRLYYAMLIAPYPLVGVSVVLRPAWWPTLLVLLSLPAAAKALGKVRAAGDTAAEIRARAAEGRYPLNSIRLHLRFGLLLIAGCALVVLLPLVPVPALPLD